MNLRHLIELNMEEEGGVGGLNTGDIYNNNTFSLFHAHSTGPRNGQGFSNENTDGIMPPTYSYHHYFELSPLLPFGMMLIISTIIFILVIFRRWPGLVAGIVAGCLTSISIYLLLLAIREQKLVYE